MLDTTLQSTRTFDSYVFPTKAKFNNKPLNVRSMTFTEKNLLIYPIKRFNSRWLILPITRAHDLKVQQSVDYSLGKKKKRNNEMMIMMNKVYNSSNCFLFSSKEANLFGRFWVYQCITHIYSRSNTLNDVNYAWYALYQFISNLCVHIQHKWAVFYHLNSCVFAAIIIGRCVCVCKWSDFLIIC